MTVEKLIEYLSKFDPDLPAFTEEGQWTGEAYLIDHPYLGLVGRYEDEAKAVRVL